MDNPINESKKTPPKKSKFLTPKASKHDTKLSAHIIGALDDIKEWDSQTLEHHYSLIDSNDKPADKVMLRRLRVHRLLLRGISRHDMATHFGVSLQTIYNDCSIINQQIKSEMQNIDLPAFVGTTVSFYDMLRNEATKLAFDEKLSTRERLKAMATPHCQNSCHPHPNNLNGGKGDNHGTIQCRTQTSNIKQTAIA